VELPAELPARALDEVRLDVHVDVLKLRFEDELADLDVLARLLQEQQYHAQVVLADDSLLGEHQRVRLAAPDVLGDHPPVSLGGLAEGEDLFGQIGFETAGPEFGHG